VKNVLVVEDNKVVAAVYRNLLNLDGLAVEIASDGEDALAQMGRSMPDAVLLDLKLPKMNGFTVLRRMRDLPLGRTVPVIVFTESHAPAMIKEAWDYGATTVLSKASSPPKVVVAAIRKALADPPPDTAAS
jgi:CheY-like chemotaxis protein